VTPSAGLPVLIPFVGAAVSILVSRSHLAQRIVSVVAVASALTSAVALLAATHDGDLVVSHVGAWPASLGIALVVDLTSSLFLVTSLATVAFVLAFSLGATDIEDDSAVFHPTYLVLTAGVALAFVTGDLFNLFVAFELLLLASYVLLTLGGKHDQVTNGMTYVVMNLVASTMFITTVAFVYAATGTVNLATLSQRFPALDDGLRLALGLALVVVFGMKAAVFPLFSWLPDAYPAAPTPITAVFAGLLTKVGVYALIRVTTLLDLDQLQPVLLGTAGVTMLVGVLGAIAQSDVKRILSFHIVSQIGYMVMGLALFTVAGVAGAILFVVHQIPVKAALFLVGGLIESREGSGTLDRVGGLVRTAPVVAALFALSALSLAGLPPFSGFVAKLALIEAGIAARSYGIVIVSLVGSALTLFSMTKIWTGVFWGDASHPVPDHERPVLSRATRLTTTGATTAAVAVTLAVAVFAGPLHEWSVTAARQLLDPSVYATAVQP
jgi:multicomponent Na+:H+ antiporter subunit D